jgi:hypothetical protein
MDPKETDDLKEYSGSQCENEPIPIVLFSHRADLGPVENDFLTNLKNNKDYKNTNGVLGYLFHGKTGFYIKATKHAVKIKNSLKILMRSLETYHDRESYFGSTPIQIQNNMRIGFSEYILECNLKN